MEDEKTGSCQLNSLLYASSCKVQSTTIYAGEEMIRHGNDDDIARLRIKYISGVIVTKFPNGSVRKCEHSLRTCMKRVIGRYSVIS
jgi:hypothetical protein